MKIFTPFRKTVTNSFVQLMTRAMALVLFTGLIGQLQAQSVTKSSAGTASSVSAGGNTVNWSSLQVSQIQNADGVNASVTVAGKRASYLLKASNWGFTSGGSGGFPTNAIISGIKVEIKRNKAQGAIVDGPNLKLLVNGNAVGNSRSRAKTQWSATPGYITYGSSSDKWGTSLTVNDIINANFGVQVAAKGALKGNSNSIARIDHIRITVYYNLAIFYSKATGSLSSLATWGTNTDGSGTAPVNFTNNGQVFILTNRSTATLDAALTISGANSKMVVGDPNNTLAKTVFTIPASFVYSGVLDCTSKDGTTVNSSDVIITNTTIPTIGTLEEGTTVTYNYAGNQSVAQAGYDNLTISGAGTKTIQSTGTGISADGVLTISSGATLALNGQTLNNSADPNGTASCIVNNGTISGTGSVVVTGDGLAIISGTGTISSLENDNSNDMQIASGANQTITSSLILSSGAFTNSGTFAMGTGTIIYRGRGMFTATSPGNNAYDVSYTSAFQEDGATPNPPGNELAGTNLANVSVDLPAGETITLNASRTLKGNFTINTGTFSAASNTLNIAGNFTNNSSFTPSTSTIVFNGSAATTQTVGGTAATTFTSVTVNTGTGGVTLAKDITVTTALALTNGKVFTGSNTLIYSLSGGGVTRTNGYVVGNLSKNFAMAAGASSRTYEVGTTNYTPITLTFAAVLTGGTVVASAIAGDHPNIGSSSIDATKSVNTYWEISKPASSGLSISTYGITVGYTAADNDAVGNAANYKLARYSGGSWSYVTPMTTPTSTQLTVPVASYLTPTGQFQVGAQGTQPMVTTQPVNKTTCNAAATSFSTTASGGIISSVVWQVSNDGGSSYSNLTITSPYSVTTSALPSANNAAVTSTLNISNTAGLDGKLYRAAFTNASGSANTSGALLSANSNPVIGTQPVAQVACVGTAASFSVSATGGGLSYQWRKGGSNISGATSPDYLISSVATGDAGNYDVVITNSCTAVTSSAVALTVNQMPAIVTQPTDQAVCAGTTTIMAVTASGAGLTYQWRKDNIALVNGVNGVSGAGTATLTINSTPLSASGVYNVLVNGSCSPNVLSNDVILTVDESATITGQPSAQAVCSGTANVQFTVAATGSGLTYQWKKDGVNLTDGGNISGTTSATLTFSTVSAANAGNYTVLVANATCTSGTLSTDASLSVTANVSPAVSIAISGGSNPTCSGTAVTFTATPVNGGTTPTYQWKKDGVSVGGNSNTYNDPGITSGSITCELTSNATCATTPTVTSNAIALSVTAKLSPSVSIALTSGSNPTCSGTSVTFTATPTNGGTPTYQWKKDGTNVGSNSASYTDAGTTAGNITCVMTTSLACVTSSTATSNAIALSVTAKVAPSVSIAVTSGSNPTCSGTSVTFTATPTNGGTPTYQWKKDGTNVGSNNASYTDAGTTAGNITCVMTTSLACVTSSTATSNAIALSVTAKVAPSVSIALTSGSNPTCSGTSVTFTATPTNGGMPTYQWKKDGTNVGSNSASYTDAGTTAGNITCVMTTSLACVTSSTATSNAIALSVTAKLAPSVSIALTSGSNPTCSGNTVTFTATPTNGGTPTYQWKKDGVTVGSNSATYSDAALVSGAVTVEMTTSLGCVTTGVATSNSITLVINPNTWLAGTDGNWNNPANWCSGFVPTASTSVLIPAANTPYPVLSANGTTGTLQIETNAFITVGPNTFSINGALTGNGTLTTNQQSTLVLAGTADQALRFTTGGQQLKELTLSHSAPAIVTLNTALSLYDAVTWTSANSTLDLNNQPVTLVSNAAGTASIGRIQGSLTGASNVTVERYIPQNPSRAWRMLSIPTVGQSIHESWQENAAAGVNPVPGYGTNLTSGSSSWAANGFDFKTSGNSMLYYNQATDQLLGVSNTAASIGTTSGYFLYIRGDRSVTPSASTTSVNSTTLRTKGSLYIGSQPATLIPAGKDAVIGNIYPSTIDLRNLTLGGGSVNTSFSVWDPKLAGSYGLGGYQTMTYNGGNYIVTPGGGSYGASGSVNNTVQSGQAFIASAFGSDGNVTFTEAAKTTGSTSTVFDVISGVSSRLVSNLYAVTDTARNLADGTLQLFDESFDNAVDGLDARKQFNFGECFYIDKSGTALIVEKRQALQASDTIRFNVKRLKRMTYLLEFMATDLNAGGLSAWLEDSYTRSSTPVDLHGATTIKFAVDANAASSAIDRFRIVFKQNAVLPLSFTNVKAYEVDNSIAVEWKVTNEENVDHYIVEKSTNGIDFTLLGTKAAGNTANTVANYNMIDAQANEGANYYRIYSVNKNGEKTFSQVVKVMLTAIRGTITAYPNPVTTETVKLQFSGMRSGTYTARLIGSNGTVILVRTISHVGFSQIESMKIPASLARGSYVLEFTHPDKTKSTIPLVIAK